MDVKFSKSVSNVLLGLALLVLPLLNISADEMPRGHYTLTGVEVLPIERSVVGDKVSDHVSDRLTHWIRFDVSPKFEMLDGTETKPFMITNPTERSKCSLTVDKPIRYYGEVVLAGTNLMDFQRFDGSRYNISMPPLNPLGIQSIRIGDGFTFAPDIYRLRFNWGTEDETTFSDSVAVRIDLTSGKKSQEASQSSELESMFDGCDLELPAAGVELQCEVASEAVPQSAHFDLENIKEGQCELVGRLSLKRQFLGTRATPSFHDSVIFHSFSGEELKRSSFTNPELEGRLMKGLAGGHSIPATMTVRLEGKRIGHDGINMSNVLIAHIEAWKPAPAEAICAAAEDAGFDEAAAVSYQAALDPDWVKEGIAVSLGKVYARSKMTPRSVALAIDGIRVFNTTSEVASIEIIELTIEQGGVSRPCVASKRSGAPMTWQVEAKSWSDGIYEKGRVPGTLWMFDSPEPIQPGKEVTLRLKLKLNGEALTLTRTVDPI